MHSGRMDRWLRTKHVDADAGGSGCLKGRIVDKSLLVSVKGYCKSYFILLQL